MKLILAGKDTTLPEVVVYTSCQSRYGLNYADWCAFVGSVNPYPFGGFFSSGTTSNSGSGGSTTSSTSYVISSVISAIGLGADSNGAVWTSLSKLLQKGNILESIGAKAGIVGLGAAGLEVFSHYNSNGNGINDLSANDWITLTTMGLIGISMGTGVGEVAIGIGALGVDIYKFWTENHG